MNIPRFSGQILYSGQNQQIKDAVAANRHYVSVNTPPALIVTIPETEKCIEVAFPGNATAKLKNSKLPDNVTRQQGILNFEADPPANLLGNVMRVIDFVKSFYPVNDRHEDLALLERSEGA